MIRTAAGMAHVVDHIVFWCLLLVNFGFGVSFALLKLGTVLSTEEIFLGKRTLSTAPLAISGMASTVSALGFIGFTAHYYMYGYHMLWYVASVLLSMPIFVPVVVSLLYRLQVTSVFEVR